MLAVACRGYHPQRNMQEEGGIKVRKTKKHEWMRELAFRDSDVGKNLRRRVESGKKLRRKGVCSDATLSSSQLHKVNIFRKLGENAYINTF